jgi:hypothetical protein
LTSTTIGNVIVVVLQHSDGAIARTVSSMTGGGATYTELQSITSAIAGNYGANIYAGIATSSETTVTIVLSGNSDGNMPDSVTVMEFSGVLSPLAESGTSTTQDNTATSTSHVAAAVTPATNETLFIGLLNLGGSSGGLTTDSDFTYSLSYTTPGRPRYVAYRIQSGSTTAQAFSNTSVTARTSFSALAAIRGDLGGGGGGATCTGAIGLLGVGKCD